MFAVSQAQWNFYGIALTQITLAGIAWLTLRGNRKTDSVKLDTHQISKAVNGAAPGEPHISQVTGDIRQSQKESEVKADDADATAVTSMAILNAKLDLLLKQKDC